MTDKLNITISYILGAIYLGVAYFFASWAFHMVPYQKIDAKAAIDIFVCIYVLVLGILLLASAASKAHGQRFLNAAFWFGLIAILSGSIGGAVIVLNNLVVGMLQIGSVLGVFYLPVIIMYLKQRKTS